MNIGEIMEQPYIILDANTDVSKHIVQNLLKCNYPPIILDTFPIEHITLPLTPFEIDEATLFEDTFIERKKCSRNKQKKNRSRKQMAKKSRRKNR